MGNTFGSINDLNNRVVDIVIQDTKPSSSHESNHNAESQSNSITKTQVPLNNDYITKQNHWLAQIMADPKMLAQVPPILLTDEMCLLAVHADWSSFNLVPTDMINKKIIEEMINATNSNLEETIEKVVAFANGVIDKNTPVKIYTIAPTKILQYIDPKLKDEKLLDKLLQLNYSIEDIIKDDIFLKLIESNKQTVLEFALSQEKQYPEFPILSLLNDNEKTLEICMSRCIDLSNHTIRSKETSHLPINNVGLKVAALCLRLYYAKKIHTWCDGCFYEIPVLLNDQALYNEIISMNECPLYIPEVYHTDKIIECCFAEKRIIKYIPQCYRTFGMWFYANSLDPENKPSIYGSDYDAKIVKDIKKYKDIIKSTTPATIEAEYQKLEADSLKYKSLIAVYPNHPNSLSELKKLYNENQTLFNIYDFVGKTMTGADFNYFMKDKTIVKLFHSTKNHNGLEFVVGLNTDPKEFNPTESCSKGGIYFIEKQNHKRWKEYNYRTMAYFSLIIVPDDARVYIETDKFKADKLYVVAFRSLDLIETISFAVDA